MSDPRPAASLIVVRAATSAPELLMARRSAGHRFMPNMLVFPGGAVDAADYLAAAATELRPEVRARLERSADPGLAHGLAMAAARELEEEVSMSLGSPPALDGLDYLCRAITPADRSIRFDARFFVVDAARVSGTPTGSHELEDPAWHTLAAAQAGDIPAATRAVLAQLERWLDAGGHGCAPGHAVPVLRDRVWGEE